MSDLFNENLDIAKSQAKFYAGTHGESYESLLSIGMQELWRLAREKGDKPHKSFRGYSRVYIRFAILHYLTQITKPKEAKGAQFVPFDEAEVQDATSEDRPDADRTVIRQLIDDRPDPECELSACEESLRIDMLTSSLDPKDKIIFDLVMSGAKLGTIAREIHSNTKYVRKIVNETLERVRVHVHGQVN